MTNVVSLTRALRISAALVGAAAVLALSPASRGDLSAYIVPPPNGGGTSFVFVYKDNEGPGQIQIQDRGYDPASQGERIAVQITQNGFAYQGLGFATLQAPGGVLICFSVLSPYTGNSYVWRAVLNGSSAQGRYEQLGLGDVEAWSMSQ